MGDFEDMNATPLGKLPMPAVQSKNDGPRVDMSASYSDILKEIAAPPQQQQHMQMQQQMQQPHQMQAMPSHFQGNDDMMFAAQQQPMYQQAPLPPRHNRLQQKQARRGGGGGGGGGGGSTRGGSGSGVWAKIKEYKSSILVTLIVFLILSYVTPKLASTVPQLLNQTGKFNALGLLVIAGTCGGIHRVMDHYVK